MPEKNWRNLKNYKCPLCNSDLEPIEKQMGEKNRMFHTCKLCPFDISNIKLNKLVSNFLKKPGKKSFADQEKDNQNALSNF